MRVTVSLILSVAVLVAGSSTTSSPAEKGELEEYELPNAHTEAKEIEETERRVRDSESVPESLAAEYENISDQFEDGETSQSSSSGVNEKRQVGSASSSAAASASSSSSGGGGSCGCGESIFITKTTEIFTKILAEVRTLIEYAKIALVNLKSEISLGPQKGEYFEENAVATSNSLVLSQEELCRLVDRLPSLLQVVVNEPKQLWALSDIITASVPTHQISICVVRLRDYILELLQVIKEWLALNKVAIEGIQAIESYIASLHTKKFEILDGLVIHGGGSCNRGLSGSSSSASAAASSSGSAGLEGSASSSSAAAASSADYSDYPQQSSTSAMLSSTACLSDAFKSDLVLVKQFRSLRALCNFIKKIPALLAELLFALKNALISLHAHGGLCNKIKNHPLFSLSCFNSFLANRQGSTVTGPGIQFALSENDNGGFDGDWGGSGSPQGSGQVYVGWEPSCGGTGSGASSSSSSSAASSSAQGSSGGLPIISSWLQGSGGSSAASSSAAASSSDSGSGYGGESDAVASAAAAASSIAQSLPDTARGIISPWLQQLESGSSASSSAAAAAASSAGGSGNIYGGGSGGVYGSGSGYESDSVSSAAAAAAASSLAQSIPDTARGIISPWLQQLDSGSSASSAAAASSSSGGSGGITGGGSGGANFGGGSEFGSGSSSSAAAAAASSSASGSGGIYGSGSGDIYGGGSGSGSGSGSASSAVAAASSLAQSIPDTARGIISPWLQELDSGSSASSAAAASSSSTGSGGIFSSGSGGGNFRAGSSGGIFGGGSGSGSSSSAAAASSSGASGGISGDGFGSGSSSTSAAAASSSSGSGGGGYGSEGEALSAATAAAASLAETIPDTARSIISPWLQSRSGSSSSASAASSSSASGNANLNHGSLTAVVSPWLPGYGNNNPWSTAASTAASTSAAASSALSAAVAESRNSPCGGGSLNIAPIASEMFPGVERTLGALGSAAGSSSLAASSALNGALGSKLSCGGSGRSRGSGGLQSGGSGQLRGSTDLNGSKLNGLGGLSQSLAIPALSLAASAPGETYGRHSQVGHSSGPSRQGGVSGGLSGQGDISSGLSGQFAGPSGPFPTGLAAQETSHGGCLSSLFHGHHSSGLGGCLGKGGGQSQLHSHSHSPCSKCGLLHCGCGHRGHGHGHGYGSGAGGSSCGSSGSGSGVGSISSSSSASSASSASSSGSSPGHILIPVIPALLGSSSNGASASSSSAAVSSGGGSSGGGGFGGSGSLSGSGSSSTAGSSSLSSYIPTQLMSSLSGGASTQSASSSSASSSGSGNSLISYLPRPSQIIPSALSGSSSASSAGAGASSADRFSGQLSSGGRLGSSESSSASSASAASSSLGETLSSLFSPASYGLGGSSSSSSSAAAASSSGSNSIGFDLDGDINESVSSSSAASSSSSNTLPQLPLSVPRPDISKCGPTGAVSVSSASSIAASDDLDEPQPLTVNLAQTSQTSGSYGPQSSLATPGFSLNSIPFVLPRWKIHSIIGTSRLCPGDIIVINLGKQVALIGKVIDGISPIVFSLLSHKNSIVSLNNGGHVFHLSSRDFQNDDECAEIFHRLIRGLKS